MAEKEAKKAKNKEKENVTINQEELVKKEKKPIKKEKNIEDIGASITRPKKKTKKTENDEETDAKLSENIEEKDNNIEQSLADEKVKTILEKAKKQGKITYGEIASELDDANPDEIEKVFDAFEELNVDLKEDLDDEEPDLEDLKEVEDIKEVLKYAKQHNINLTIIGNASNVLVLDKGIRGITLEICLNKQELEEKEDGMIVTVRCRC